MPAMILLITRTRAQRGSVASDMPRNFARWPGRTTPQRPNRRRVSGDGFRLTDRVAGHRETLVRRRFITPWPIRLEAGAVIISHPEGEIRLAPTEGDIMVTPVEIWHAYGRSETGRCIEIACRAKLPWTGAVEVRPS